MNQSSEFFREPKIVLGVPKNADVQRFKNLWQEKLDFHKLIPFSPKSNFSPKSLEQESGTRPTNVMR